MNEALIPAAIAAGGGTTLITSIYLHERRRDERMRASRKRIALRFPLGLEPLRATSALSGLTGLHEPVELVLETAASADGITHSLLVPEMVKPSVTAALTAAMPGLRIEDTASAKGTVTVAVKIFLPTPSLLRVSDPVTASRTLLAGLAGLAEVEQVILRWALRPSRAPKRDNPDEPSELAVWRAWERKSAELGFDASGLVLVKAESRPRARALADHVTAWLRSRWNLGAATRFTWERGGRSMASLPRTTRTSGWLSAAELLPLISWPLGSEPVPGVEVGGARDLPVRRDVPRLGRRLFIGRDSLGERAVALTPESARHHMAVVGPSGVGKSVLLARSILDDLQSGFGGAVLDPKADLVQTVIERVPPQHADRVVVLDPSVKGKVPGIDLMSAGDPELRSDVIVGALRNIFASSWGIRSDLWLRVGIRTLAEVPGATLADLGRLYFESAYRERAISRLRDPMLVSSWQHYQGLSEAEKAQYVASPMQKIMALLDRPSVRAVLANADPKLDIAKLLEQGRWLLVSLSPGVLGEPAARLLGSVLMYVIWSAIEARAAVPPEHRSPLFVYVDELASLSDLPFSFEALAERSRGLGAGLTVATQNLSRLPESVRAALLGNVATLISFRAGADEARRLAKELPGLSPLDLQSLGRFEVAARIGTGIGSAVSVVTGRTEALGAVTGQAERIRATSTDKYGSELPTITTERAPDQGDGPPALGRDRRRA